MYSTGEYYRFICIKTFSSGYYSFVYTDDENNVLGLIQLTTESAYILEAEISDQYLVHTMGNDILQAM